MRSKILGSVMTIAVLLFAVFLSYYVATFTYSYSKNLGAGVKVLVSGGHGSGVHIGDGYILTAAHVVNQAKEVRLKADDNEIMDAEILWFNDVYDVALLRSKKGKQKLNSAVLSCRVPSDGENVRAFGNPLRIEFVTTYGKVAGKPRAEGHWKSVSPVSMPIVQGQSGGPVYDDSGAVVGITVGVLLTRLGFSPSMTSVGFIVPGSVICGLMARV